MSKRGQQLHLGFDTEDKAGVPTMYALTSKLSDKTANGDRGEIFDAGPVSQGELLRRLAEYADKYDHVFVWCLNIAYDLINFLGESLPDVMRLHLARKKIVGAVLKGHPKVSFYALERFFPKTSVKQMGVVLNLPKLELAFDDPKRCIRDAKIAEITGLLAAREMAKLRFPMKFSPVSAGFAALEEEAGQKLPFAKEWVRLAGQAALYGARNETYFRGELKSKPGAQIHYFDSNYHYLKAMCEPLPDYTIAEVSRKPEAEYYITEATVRCTAKNRVAPLPYRHPIQGLIYPEGTFRGVWTSEDMKIPGIEVLRYHRTCNFPATGPYLAPFVKRLQPKDTDNPLVRALKKNLYTGFSGKFSQNPKWTFFTHWTKAKDEDYWNGINLGDWILAEREGQYPRWANFVWSAFIQGRGRRWHWGTYEEIWGEGGEVLYGDNDSALCTLSAPIRAQKILDRMKGKLKHQSLRWARVYGPKAYLFEDRKGIVHLSAKGIPGKLHENIIRGEEEFEGETPESFFGVLRASAITDELGVKNSWGRRNFKLKKAFYNRMLAPGDLERTIPLRLANGELVISRAR